MEDRPCDKSFGLLLLAAVLMRFAHTLSRSAPFRHLVASVSILLVRVTLLLLKGEGV